MSQVVPAPHLDARAPDRFLRELERRALQMADLALGRRDDALGAVDDAMRGFVAGYETQAPSEWPSLFWHLLDAGLEARLHPPRTQRRPSFPTRAADADDPRAAVPDPSPSRLFMQLSDRAAMTALHAALRTLAPPERQAFLLRVREALDPAGCAEVMCLSESLMRMHLFRALRNLRARLRTHPHSVTARSQQLDGRWILRCRALLDDAARELDLATVSRLEQVRRSVLNGTTPQTRPPRQARWLVVGGGLAVFAGLALILSRLLPSPEPAMPPATPLPLQTPAPPPLPPPRIAPSEDTPLAAPDFDLLLDDEDATLLEDLEFYAWLAAEELRDG